MTKSDDVFACTATIRVDGASTPSEEVVQVVDDCCCGDPQCMYVECILAEGGESTVFDITSLTGEALELAKALKGIP